MNAFPRTINAETSQEPVFHVPDEGNSEILAETIYQLMDAFLVALSEIHQIECTLDIDENFVGITMGDFRYEHRFPQDPMEVTDAMIAELSFNILCALMRANEIRDTYF